jgi:hypothetical protein
MHTRSIKPTNHHLVGAVSLARRCMTLAVEIKHERHKGDDRRICEWAWEAQGRWGTNLWVSMNGSGALEGTYPAFAHATLHIPIVLQGKTATKYTTVWGFTVPNSYGRKSIKPYWTYSCQYSPRRQVTHGVIKSNSDAIVTLKLTLWSNGIVASHTQ